MSLSGFDQSPRSRLCVSCCRGREGSALCLPVSFPFMCPDFFIVCITDHYMLNIDWAASTSNAHRSPFGRPNIDSPQSAHQGFRCQIKIPKFLLHPYKQVSGDHSFYSFLLIFFPPGKPAAHAAVTPACSPTMRADKVFEA